MTDLTPEKLDAPFRFNAEVRWRTHGDGRVVFVADMDGDWMRWDDYNIIITALRAQLAETDALIAAAYEAAARTLDYTGDNAADNALNQSICCSGYMCGCRGASVGDLLSHIIRALTQSTAREAYSAAIAAAEQAGYEAGLQAAAHWIEGVPGSLPNRQEYAAHIRGLSAKKEGAQ